MLHCQRKQKGCRAGCWRWGRGLLETHTAGRALPPAGGGRQSGAQKGGVQEASPSAPRPCGARARRRRRAEGPAAGNRPGAADPGPAGGGSRGAPRPRQPPEPAAQSLGGRCGCPAWEGLSGSPSPGADGGRGGSGACYTASGL